MYEKVKLNILKFFFQLFVPNYYLKNNNLLKVNRLKHFLVSERCFQIIENFLTDKYYI